MFRNVVANSVAGAWGTLCHFMHDDSGIIIADSRNGKVRTSLDPFTLTLEDPRKRVLFCPRRNANPVFHLAEALWMLAGSNEVEFVKKYNKQMYSYSDNGITFNAAYGHRWRNHFGHDQLLIVIEMLKSNPQDRRVVLSMWDPREDLNSDSLDVPCNTQAVFRIYKRKLHMTTFNRSNDLVWGLMGANCVHLTILQEFIAAAVGVELGTWHHVTNNLHVYEHHFQLIKDIANAPFNYETYPTPAPLVKNPQAFLDDCADMVTGEDDVFREPFFDGTVAPMLQSWAKWKDNKPTDALYLASCIDADDWRRATSEWYKRALARKTL